ncbi:hypothetical protein HMPREF9075_00548 [Capnocytophaga sp. oral taxon 332 str. F0381]|jgi:membrane protein|uniref:hypothetical protein n=1 Tax=Capnocytophaga sp. oral taxon 332 TaxID=712213 RepID=UPI0002A41DC6|nr:hypothetical protein [Capnocytophaga sp. oral taxon 332]EKY11656.1 hypothetical protein HMPREF9075_00548 [Capnocytophaga sp. oral taxon 332 str. F0381]
MNARSFFDYAYLAIAAYAGYNAYEWWGKDTQSCYLNLAFAVAAVAMFFFRRRLRYKKNK